MAGEILYFFQSPHLAGHDDGRASKAAGLAKSDDQKTDRFLRHLEPLQGSLEAYCRRSVYQASEVEDVLQNAVMKAFRDFDLYVEGTNFRAWIFRYLNLEIYAGNRQLQRASHEVLVTEPAIEEAWERAIDEPLFERLLEDPEAVLNRCDQALADAVMALKPLERSVLLLRAIGQFKHREMAEILEVPIGTVMSCLTRGRQRIRARLTDCAREQAIFDAGTESVHEA